MHYYAMPRYFFVISAPLRRFERLLSLPRHFLHEAGGAHFEHCRHYLITMPCHIAVSFFRYLLRHNITFKTLLHIDCRQFSDYHDFHATPRYTPRQPFFTIPFMPCHLIF